MFTINKPTSMNKPHWQDSKKRNSSVLVLHSEEGHEILILQNTRNTGKHHNW